jgi:splicing factor 45
MFTPVSSLKPRIAEEHPKPRELIKPKIIQTQPIVPMISNPSALNEWEEFLAIEDEYNPAVPNEYEKIVKERRERNKKEDRKRSHRSPSPSFRKSGFGGRATSEDEDNFRPSTGSNRVGTAIAPPKSLVENSTIVSDKMPNINSYGASAVAAKIMARYGFKDGQGLGKQEQGISMALQVEKTSKRGGRIIHEKELAAAAVAESTPQPAPASSQEQSITEMMKAPSKVIMLRNMVGPGEVDDELEPEVKEECNRKYGEVITVHILEMQNVAPEETVRIFVEFSRIESAIKGLVDLNGRFFGGELEKKFKDRSKTLILTLSGRQVRCVFYSSEKYENFIFDD